MPHKTENSNKEIEIVKKANGNSGVLNYSNRN